MKKFTLIAIILIYSAQLFAQNDFSTVAEEINQALSLNQNEKALSLLNNALEAYPNNHDLYFVKGTILEKLGKTKQAITAYKKSVSIKPSYDAYYNLCVIYYNKGVDNINIKKTTNQSNQDKIALDIEKDLNTALFYLNKIFYKADPNIDISETKTQILNTIESNRWSYDDSKLLSYFDFSSEQFNFYSYQNNNILLHTEIHNSNKKQIDHFFASVTDPKNQNYTTEGAYYLDVITLETTYSLLKAFRNKELNRIKFYKKGICIGDSYFKQKYYHTNDYDHELDEINISMSLSDGKYLCYALYENNELYLEYIASISKRPGMINHFRTYNIARLFMNEDGAPYLCVKINEWEYFDTNGDGYFDKKQKRGSSKYKKVKKDEMTLQIPDEELKNMINSMKKRYNIPIR